ncbi:MAG: hypothetical protein KC486_03205 [Myxococcales bacterium]|nr:hypothetical protein [Myxococcales bacterium]
MNPAAPSLPLRALARIMSGVNWLFYGYSVPFMGELLRSYGLRGASTRGAALAELAQLVERELGERDAHMLIGFASLWNGCMICALGHIYAANLAHFRDRGELFPLDEVELRRAMQTATDAEILAYVEERLTATDDARLLELLRHLYAIKRADTAAPDAVDRDTELLHAVASAYDWLNHCTIYAEGEEPPVIAYSQLNRHYRLRSRYARARAAATQRR